MTRAEILNDIDKVEGLIDFKREIIDDLEARLNALADECTDALDEEYQYLIDEIERYLDEIDGMNNLLYDLEVALNSLVA